jgi:hypothetical protein
VNRKPFGSGSPGGWVFGVWIELEWFAKFDAGTMLQIASAEAEFSLYL